MVTTVEATQVQDVVLGKERAVILDVLAKESYENRHIPHALHADIHAADFDERVQTLVPDRATPLITYCAGPDCSASVKAAERLRALGYRDVREFRGGLQGWRQAGYEYEGAMYAAPSEPQGRPSQASEA